MLDDNLKNQLKTYLQNVKHPIEIVAATDDSGKSKELQQLLREIAGLSERITVVERSGGDERTPSFTTRPSNRSVRWTATTSSKRTSR